MRSYSILSALPWLALCLSLSCLSCSEPPKLTDAAFNRVTFYLGDSNSVREVRQSLIADIDAATAKVDIAMTSIRDQGVIDALVRAAGRGVAVRVVGDEDFATDAGFVALGATSAQIKLGDGEIKYLPEPTITSILQDCQARDDQGPYIQCTRRDAQLPVPLPDDGLMIRPGSYNVMSSQFVIIDDLLVYNLSSPDTGQVSLWVGWRANSQDLAIAFTREFQQMFGGVFSTTLNQFNGPVKSTVHGIVYDSHIPSDRPGRRVQLLEGYLTDHGLLEVYFNPQQRLVKELIDEIYKARGSVYLMTDTLENKYVIDALAYKAKLFDVRIILRDGATIPDRLKGQATIRTADPSLTYVPTVMVNNISAGKGGKSWPRVVATISHKLYQSAPFEVFNPAQLGEQTPNDIVRVYPSDMFTDGAMWMMREAYFKSAEERNARYADGTNIYDRFAIFWDQSWRASTEVQ